MKGINIIPGFLRSGPVAGAGAGSIRRGAAGRLWSALTRPFSRSIYIRFQYVFGLVVVGFVAMAAITMTTSRMLLDQFAGSVSEANFELMPAHHLQVSLQKAEHLAYLYAMEGDRSAKTEFTAVVTTANSEFRKLSNFTTQFGSVEHAHSNVSVSATVDAWQDALVKLRQVFQYEAGTAEAARLLTSAHIAIDPVYEAISRFHYGSMRDMQVRLTAAHGIASWAYLATFVAILIGLALLIVMGAVVGRSILQPIAQLQVAAQKLGNKDFTYRVRLRNAYDELGQLGRAFNAAFVILDRLYAELKRRSTHDGLTGVLNRAAFDERLSVECDSADRHERPLSLLMVDVDFFKRVNDNYGHQVGDNVLLAVAELLGESIRPADVLARYGGEEFVVILPETDEGAAVEIADRLRSAAAHHIFTSARGDDIGVTVSIGCAIRRPGAMSPSDVVRAADAALLQAKKAGRNRVVSVNAPVSARSTDLPTVAA